MNKTAAASMNPITLSVIWGALVSIGEEMGAAIARTAYSNAVKDGYDFSAAVFDTEGRLVAQGDFSPGHLGAMLYVIKHVLNALPLSTLVEGDTIILNDVEMGTGHFPDITMVTPVFLRGTPIGFVANTAHHVDVGGSVPGSQIVEGVSDYFQEGLRILPVKAWEAGRENAQVMTMIRANVRMPETVMGDLRAQANANHVGSKRLAGLADRYGPDLLAEAMATILARSEASMREAISALPVGEYQFEDFLDDAGRDTPPVKIKVTARIEGGEITLDFTGSSPQTASGLNSYLNYTKAYAICVIRCVTIPSAPHNEGFVRPIKFIVPEGSFFNPKAPAGGSARATINARIYEGVMGALSQAIPDRVMAAISHWSNPNISGIDHHSGRRFIFYDLIMGGTGARPTKDGIEAISAPYNSANIPVEVQETNTPLIVERIELIADSGGAGKYRGGLGLRKDVRVYGAKLQIANLTDRCKFRPFGLFGAQAGQLGSTILNPHTAPVALTSKCTQQLQEGDVISFRLAGAGGYGDPLERAPASVRRDCIGGYISIEGAARDYGVVVDPKSFAVDLVATEALRAAVQARPAKDHNEHDAIAANAALTTRM